MTSIAPKTLDEGERLLARVRSHTHVSDVRAWEDWIDDHASALLAVARERDALREERKRIANAAGNPAPTEMLEVAVRQWKKERDNARWWIRAACKEHPELLPPTWVTR